MDLNMVELVNENKKLKSDIANLIKIVNAKLSTAEECKQLKDEIDELNNRHQALIGLSKKTVAMSNELKKCKATIILLEKDNVPQLKQTIRDLRGHIERNKLT